MSCSCLTDFLFSSYLFLIHVLFISYSDLIYALFMFCQFPIQFLFISYSFPIHVLFIFYSNLLCFLFKSYSCQIHFLNMCVIFFLYSCLFISFDLNYLPNSMADHFQFNPFSFIHFPFMSYSFPIHFLFISYSFHSFHSCPFLFISISWSFSFHSSPFHVQSFSKEVIPEEGSKQSFGPRWLINS